MRTWPDTASSTSLRRLVRSRLRRRADGDTSVSSASPSPGATAAVLAETRGLDRRRDAELGRALGGAALAAMLPSMRSMRTRAGASVRSTAASTRGKSGRKKRKKTTKRMMNSAMKMRPACLASGHSLKPEREAHLEQ